MKNYRVELVIDGDVLKSLEQEIMGRKITDTFFGPGDEFLFLVVKGCREKSPRLHIYAKTKKKGSGKKGETKPDGKKRGENDTG